MLSVKFEEEHRASVLLLRFARSSLGLQHFATAGSLEYFSGMV